MRTEEVSTFRAELSEYRTHVAERDERIRQLDDHVRRRDDRLKEKDDILQQVRRQQQQRQQQQQQQGNRRSHFPRAVHSRHPRRRRYDPLCCTTLFAARRYLQRTRYSAWSVRMTFYSRYDNNNNDNDNNNNSNKAIVDHTSPHCALPSPPAATV